MFNDSENVYRRPQDDSEDAPAAAGGGFVAPELDGPSGPSAPQPPQAKDPYDIKNMLLTDQELKANRERKNQNAGLAMVADALSNGQSFGNFFLGKLNPHRDVGAMFRQDSENADQKIKDKQALLSQAMQEPDRQRMVALLDKDSDESKAEKQQLAAAYEAMGSAGLFKNNPEQLAQLKNNVANLNGFQAMRLAQSPVVKDFTSMAGEQMKAKIMADRLAAQQNNFNTRLGNDANKQYSHELGTTENQLGNANRVLALVDKMKGANPELASTKTMRTDLAGVMAQMFNGGKPATVYGMSHADFDSLYGRVQNGLNILTGNQGGTMTEAQLGQLEKDISALRSEYAKQHEIKFKSFIAGAPDPAKPALTARYEAARSGYLGGGDSQPQRAQSPGPQGGGQSGVAYADDGGGDMVDVISPEGQPGKIPRNNLEKALKRGFKQAQ